VSTEQGCHDSETVDDLKTSSLSEVTDDLCTVSFIDIVPIGRVSNDYHTQGFIYPVVEVKLEDLLDMKQEPVDKDDKEYMNYSVTQKSGDKCKTEDPCFTIPVRVRTSLNHCSYSTEFSSSRLTISFMHRLVSK